MPVYPFICLDCKTQFEKRISYKEYGMKVIHCTRCGSENIKRRISPVPINSTNNSAGSLSENMPDFDQMDKNPEELGRALRKMGRQTGEQMEPEFDEVVERLEKGQSFDQIEKELPEISAPSSSTSHDQS